MGVVCLMTGMWNHINKVVKVVIFHTLKFRSCKLDAFIKADTKAYAVKIFMIGILNMTAAEILACLVFQSHLK